jgi:hypothetical protein
MQLNAAQQQEILENGFTILRDAVPRLLINEALRAIYHSLGKRGMHPDELAVLRSQTYCRELTTTPAITDLFQATPLRSLCESALGENAFLPVARGQIALRFPTLAAPPPAPQPHLDGMASPNNGVEPGTFGNFTALLGVLLTDLPAPFMGNFCVWPGSHLLYEKYFQEHGVETFTDGTPQIPLSQPQQVLGKAGDAVLCHYQLGHGVAANISPHIRAAIFFRLEHRQHNAHRREVLADIWRDWPGLQNAAQATAKE